MSKNAQQVQVESRAMWRTWLSQNYAQKEGVWLVTFKKHCGDKYLPYEDIVEEAMCFGWVDSSIRKLDEDRTMHYISPRRKGSIWSRSNKQRVAKLTAAQQMMPPGLAEIEAAKKDGLWTIYDDIEDIIIPLDLKEALKVNPNAEKFFYAFSDSSKKNILWWIKSAKRPATRLKRINETVELAADNIKANDPR